MTLDDRPRSIGQYECFFEGRRRADFSSDFIVIEHEKLKRGPD